MVGGGYPCQRAADFLYRRTRQILFDAGPFIGQYLVVACGNAVRQIGAVLVVAMAGSMAIF